MEQSFNLWCEVRQSCRACDTNSMEKEKSEILGREIQNNCCCYVAGIIWKVCGKLEMGIGDSSEVLSTLKCSFLFHSLYITHYCSCERLTLVP